VAKAKTKSAAPKRIRIKRDAPISAAQLAEIFTASGLRRPVDDLGRIERMRANANLSLTAWDGTKLVGVLRALTDFSFCCYVSDLGVRASHQRRGIGRALFEELRDMLGDEVMVLLLSAEKARDYYPKVGFEAVNNAFKIPRGR
jgi:GNAT superfamily N-acetyltransferase